MKKSQYAGAKWWKFDFHTHTPASSDFMIGVSKEDRDRVTAKFWLKKFMDKEIDCVVVTDHNSGAWIDILKNELKELESVNPDWFSPLYLFPGVEISVSGGVHLLGVFDPTSGTSDIDSLLGAVRYDGTKGEGNGETNKTLSDVTRQVIRLGGIAIPAHVDREKGLFTVMERKTLEKQALNNPDIYAIELIDESYIKPASYMNKKLQWTEVVGSDTHNFRQGSFGTFTWVKMDAPTIEGLKLALMDGQASVNRNMDANPNRHSDVTIESIVVDESRFMGRVRPLECRFSPFLNTVIGGRGSGKSSLLEFMRLTLQQDEEIPDGLAAESSKYFNTGDDDLLLDTSQLSLIYLKGLTRYRLNWSSQTDAPSLYVETTDGWQAEDGDIKSLFPAYIYSQKQVFSMAQKPDALLDVIDKDSIVDFETYRLKRNELVNRYKNLVNQTNTLLEKLSQKSKLSGTLNHVNRQLEEIEKSGHEDILRDYRGRQRQLDVISKLEEHWDLLVSHLQDMHVGIEPMEYDEEDFEGHQEILNSIKSTDTHWLRIRTQIGELTDEFRQIVSNWHRNKETATWMKTLQNDIDKYEILHTQLEQQGIDPNEYSQLLEQQATLQSELALMNGYAESVDKLQKEKKQVLKELTQTRKELTNNRQEFLYDVLYDTSSVKISVVPFSQDWIGIEKDIRRLLHCENRFDNDFALLKTIYENATPENLFQVEAIKNILVDVHLGKNTKVKDKRFASHVRSLTHESLCELICWFPKDKLEITYKNDGKDQNIRQGSPGQKTAALLTFILSYGNEPLLLDQPEDDLDNELIYDLIVRQLRQTKSKRQIIVVTHNANIVVNGDAEMVHCMRATGGQTEVLSGSLQNNNIRQRICDALEGGDRAFEQRYRRIYLVDRSVE